MSRIDLKWDINKYRTEHEMDHEWNLKKKFLLAHIDKYEEDRLISLAQTFCNVHFLGCRYDEPVMEMIESLSKGLSEKNEKWERQSFVAASSAVEERVTSQMKNRQQQSLPARGPINFLQSSNLESTQSTSKFQNQNQQEEGRKRGDIWIRGQKRTGGPAIGYKDEGPYSKKTCLDEGSQKDLNIRTTNYSIEHKRIQFDIQRVVESGPFGKVVVFQSALATDENPVGIIERTASAAHMSTSFDFTPQSDGTTCKLSLDGLYLATGQGKNQKIAKEVACKVAIERLKETSFTIIVKAAFVGSESVDRELNNDTNVSKISANVDTPIADSNIGSKMLKLMGWSGGGLGKNEQGMEEPLRPYDCNVRRGGLGIANFGDFKRKIIGIIEDFAHRETKEDLVFSPEFTKEERKVIHELVRKYNLKSRSFGRDEANRRLVVFKKIRPLEIVQDLMTCGGETDKYKLIPPISLNSI